MNAFAVVGVALGMRHGTDPDHLAAIDGLTRIRPRATNGVYFALGHGLVVILLAVGIGHFLANRFALVGPWNLILIGAVNLWRLVPGSTRVQGKSSLMIAQPFLLGMLWLLTLAAAGAAALTVIFGVQHLPAAARIFASASAGAILRRDLAHSSANVFLQPFRAALLSGVVGALAVRYQLSSSLRLVAVCACMILVPGPPVLTGALDLTKGRVHLGAARMISPGLVVLANSSGLLLGLALLGVSLPVAPAGRAARLWLHSGRWKGCQGWVGWTFPSDMNPFERAPHRRAQVVVK